MKRRREIKQSTDILPLAHNLERIVQQTADLPQVRKDELNFGDLVMITTRNSVYSIYALDGGLYLISGGWFDRKGLSPAKITIAGCTLGGRIIKSDIVAGCGLRLEFGNRVVTTPIHKVCVVRLGSQD